MFELYEQHGNGGVKVDVTNSIYVGDASGRAKSITITITITIITIIIIIILIKESSTKI